MIEQELTLDDFAAFFRDVHDYDPFPWQQRLTEHVINRKKWPKVIDLPTGTGKTAVLDIAIFALAVQPAISPRRIVFVVDRRIIVDQVYKRAWRIQQRIKESQTRVLQKVRKQLSALCDGDSLGVGVLRGGIPVNNEWAHRPEQPWVVVSTVDQFGSRLLFRGYGTQPGMWPIHAGLTGNDCLVILDEVHLSVPFSETLTQVAQLQGEVQLPRRFGIVEMSATPSNAQISEVEHFVLRNQDLNECEELRRRVKVAKKAELILVQNDTALFSRVVKIVDLISKSKNLTSEPNKYVRSVGIVVNRVRSAREIYRLLEESGYTVYLITGRMRPLDRIDVLKLISPAVDPDRKREANEFTVVVTTQAIEVGADFSFDALVTECAAIDSLRQRFGRLDRRGACYSRTGTPARAWIIGLKSVINVKQPDPIYGDAIKVTWKELDQRCDTEGFIEIGPRDLVEFPKDAYAPKAPAPLLLKTHIDAWVQTSPQPITQPALEWFLHGIGQDRVADVSVLWRWDRSAEALRLVPPRQAEILQIPIEAARSWLAAGDEVDVADVARRIEGNGSKHSKQVSLDDGNASAWVRWVGFGKDPQYIGLEEIRPGDMLIVDPKLGGLRAGTWDPSSVEEVLDLGDEAQAVSGRKVTMRADPRLHGAVSPPLPSAEVKVGLSAREHISQWLNQYKANADGLSPRFIEIIDKLTCSFEYTQIGFDEKTSDTGYYVLIERDAYTNRTIIDLDETTLDGSDEGGSMTGTGITLRSHLDGVGERAAHSAEQLGLPSNLIEDLRLAGRLHDLGKVDRRFQAQLVGGDPVALEMLTEPLAKSQPGVLKHQGDYPTGMRHEIASVAMIESNADVLASAHDKDLVLHLVGAHHGWGRPLPPIIEDSEPQMLTYVFEKHTLSTSSELAASCLAIDMADRFWYLVEKYGYHGLAWLEAILRLADHRQSADEAMSQ